MFEHLDDFVRGYITAALWSETDGNNEPLDANYDQHDFDSDALKSMREDCERFIRENETDLDQLPENYGGRSAEYTVGELAGHDFWLTRNGHGVGFWDRGLGELGERLTDASHKFGESYLEVGDDNKIHIL